MPDPKLQMGTQIATAMREAAEHWQDGEWCSVQRDDLLTWANEVERLRAELEKARVRFEMISRGHPAASAEAGARDAWEALRHG